MAADSLMSQFSDLKMKKGKQWSQFIFAFDMCIFFREVWVVAARGQLDQ